MHTNYQSDYIRINATVPGVGVVHVRKVLLYVVSVVHFLHNSKWGLQSKESNQGGNLN